MSQSIGFLNFYGQEFLAHAGTESLYVYRMELKDWIREARRHAKFSQEKLGEALGRGKANVSAWESGSHEPSFAQVLVIAEVTNYSLLSLAPSLAKSGLGQGATSPLSEELMARLTELDGDARRKAENMLRGALDMDPLPREANAMAA